MYDVTITNINMSEVVDERSFTFGTWSEIGYWLDHYGYNEPKYMMHVRFTGE